MADDRTNSQAERAEELDRMTRTVDHLTPKPGEWSSDGLYVTDVTYLLAEVERLEATLQRVRNVANGAERDFIQARQQERPTVLVSTLHAALEPLDPMP